MATAGNHAVFSISRLLLLAEDFESDAVAINYAKTFLDLLPGRIEHIVSIVRVGDSAAAMDSILSLKVRSHMLGAEALEQSCRTLQKCLSDGDPSSAVIAAHRVAKDAHALRLALEEFLRAQET
jgi:HPt (histidine-containing phosphotransfer) domain-containing protein